MPVALNNIRLEILKLFRNNQSEKELQEIRSLLIAYLGDKVTKETDRTFLDQGYYAAVFEKWKQEYFRKTALKNKCVILPSESKWKLR